MIDYPRIAVKMGIVVFGCMIVYLIDYASGFQTAIENVSTAGKLSHELILIVTGFVACKINF
ncbi:MAG: hypothetical protein WAV31_04710 [Candidatus Moraniibacteriota bacterium]